MWVRQGRIRIDEQWWKWDKEEEVTEERKCKRREARDTEIRGKVGGKKE